MNAKIEWENIYRPTIGKDSLHSMSNDNKARLIHFAMSNGIIISSIYFQRKDIYKQTWIPHDVAIKNQIDHIIIDNKHRSWFSNVKSHRGADADTDHYLVYIATLSKKLSILWKENKNRKSTNLLNVDRLRNPLEIAQYRKRIIEELYTVNEKEENIISNYKTKWTNIKNVITSAAKNLKEKPYHNKKKHWFNNECMEAVKKRNETRMQMIHNPSQENQERHKHFKELINKTIRRQKKDYMRRKHSKNLRERGTT
jgi:DNA polymerase III alpha subunit (gram-positive type)